MSERIGNYRCSTRVSRCMDFEGNNIYAKTLVPGVYVVYSYGPHFPMFACLDGTWYRNEDGYSKTTAKHKTQAHPGCATTPVTTKALKDLIDDAICAAVAKAKAA